MIDRGSPRGCGRGPSRQPRDSCRAAPRPTARARKAGWYRGTHVAGMFLVGPVLAASAIKALLFPGTYFLIAALFALSVALSPIVFCQHVSAREVHAELGLRELRARLFLLATDADLRSACVVEFAAQALNNFYTFFIVVIAVSSLGLGPGEAAGLVAAQGFSYVFALFALGPAAGRLGALRVHVGSCAVIGCSLLLLGTSSRLPLLWLGGAALGLGLGMLQVVNLTRFARIGARIGRGKTAGMNALVGPAGGLAGSLLGGWLGQSVGLQRVFLLFVPLVVLLARRLAKRSEGTSLLIDRSSGGE
jgi:predicted MFS family arabinose efflux permease